MHLLCPHCRNPIEMVELKPREEVVCPSCGSSFHVEPGTTKPFPQMRTIGRFEVLETIGVGAFGTVYKARDPELQRSVAIKVPRAGNLSSGAERDRFFREARSVAQLRHPSIVSVHEVGENDGVPYLVSDFVEGVTLADLLTSRRLKFHESAKLIAQLADALQYAHDMGVVHRDVKPSNVMLEHAPAAQARSAGDGPRAGSVCDESTGLTPRLMDFGLAKRDGGEITMTMDGQVLGTPAYMSPEQARGDAHKVDGRSDVYSLGVIFYGLLTGELPFRGNQRMLLHQVLHDDPRPPRKLNDRIPRDLETICLKAMAKEPGRRYQSAHELAEDIRRWLKDEPIQARPVGRLERAWRWCRRNPLAASLLATLVLATAGMTGLAVWALVERDRASIHAGKEKLAREEADRHAADAIDQKNRAEETLEKLAEEQKRTAAARDAEAKRRKQYRTALDEQTSYFLDTLLGEQQVLTGEHKEFLRKALKSYEDLAAELGKDEESRLGVARAHRRVGDIHQRLGEHKEAEIVYQRAIELFKQLVTDFPAVLRYRSDLAKCRHNLGASLQAVGRGRDAEAEYRAALATHKQLAADFPKVPEYRQDLAMSHNSLGILFEADGKALDAEAEYRAALAIHKQLAADYHNVPEYRQALAMSHNQLGNLLSDAKYQEAESEYRLALAIFKRLTDDFPHISKYQSDLALCYNNLGRLLIHAGKPQEAQTECRAALAIQKQLAADFPAMPQYKSNLAKTHNNMALSLKNAGKPRDAEIEYRIALAIQKQLAADFPLVPQYRSDLGKSLYNLGNLLAESDAEGADKAYRAALDIHKQLATDFPAVPDYKDDLASSHHCLGVLLQIAGKYQEAETEYRAALDIRKQLADDYPNVLGYQNDLAVTIVNLAIVSYSRLDFRTARKMLEQALPLHQATLKASPSNPTYRLSFRNCVGTLCGTLLALSDHKAAADAAEQLAQAAVDPVDDVYSASKYLALCIPLVKKDGKLDDQQRKELAQQYADRAMKLLQQAVKNGFRNAEALKKARELEPLRSREDFQKLLVQLEK